MLHLVPHTHWDREWYEPFQRFRLRLVDLLDEVVARAEREPAFRFTLDGQIAAVDDYLEVRPEAADRVAALVAGGQLAVGPWQILMDEFLCAGETMVRNLEAGWSAAQRLGTPMAVGYLPDMFGHCAQLPQLLRRAGIRHACVWRGVPSIVDSHAFRWEAPDGSFVRAEYLPDGYGNAAHLFDVPERMAAEATELLNRMRPWYGDAPVLAMYGTDHAAPTRRLVDLVDRHAAGGQDPVLRIGTLGEYVLAGDPDDRRLPHWRGELRSHARANILPGVLSARLPLKRALAAAERMVTRYAEPWSALAGAVWTQPVEGRPADWPQRYLAMAWDRIIASSCHDSVTGCGVDETAVQVAARIAEAEQLGRAVRDRVLAGLAASAPAGAVLVANPTPRERTGLVRWAPGVPEDWPAVAGQLPDGRIIPTQEVARPARLLTDEPVAAADLTRVFSRIHGRELFGGLVDRVDVTAGELTFHLADRPAAAFDRAAVAAEVAAAARAHPGPWRLRILDEPRRELVADVPVPALGWAALRPVRAEAVTTDRPVRLTEQSTVDGAVSGLTMDNGLLAVIVRPDGTLTLSAADGTVLDGVGRMVDGGDCGDTYNYAPPADDRLVDVPERIAVRVLPGGPLLAEAEIRRTYRWPLAAEATQARSAQTVPVELDMRVQLRVGEPFARLTVSFDNPCRDHRLRLHVPLADPVAASAAEGQFAVVERGPTAEGGYGERPLPTFPAYGFVDAGGAGVLLAAASEYELTADGRELAITLVRAVGLLSRNVHPYRADPAGPQLPTPAAQCPGRQDIGLAVQPHAGGWASAGVLASAERFAHDLVAVPGSGPAGGPLPAAAGLRVTGDGVVLASLRRRSDWLELRLVAESPAARTAVVELPAGIAAARRCDLLGRPLADLQLLDGRLHLPLGPWEIATVALQPAAR